MVRFHLFHEGGEMMAYELNGVEYPSVTTITGILDKPALLGWASNCAVDFIKERLDDIKDPTDVHKGEDILEQARKAYTIKRDSAADAGTQCHHAIQMYIEGHDPYPSLKCKEARNGFEAFLAWEKMNHVEWLQSEVAVFSEAHGYAGRFDAIAMVNGHRYLIDFKTSKGVWDEHRYQICAYRQAYNEMLEEGQEPIEHLAVLHLDKSSGEPSFIPVMKNIERYTNLFNTLCMVYYLLKDRRLKNNPFVALAKVSGQ
jgi:hypothetical protein